MSSTLWDDLGPFFAVSVHGAGARPAPPWRALDELVTDPAVLRERVAGIRERLGGARVAPRVAASVAHLGIVARLVSPVLAAAVHGLALRVDLANTWWQPVIGGPVPLSVTDPVAAQEDPVQAAVDGPVREVGAAVREFSVSEQILWGNVASACNGAVTMIGTARPDLRGAAAALVAGLLDTAPLRGTATVTADGRFRRRSCCLIYRAAPDGSGPVCGDCVLTDR